MSTSTQTTIKTKTSTGRPMAWFTLKIIWQPWKERKLSSVQTIRGDFRFQEKPENIPNMLKDLLNYIEDNLGTIAEATLYDNRVTYPFCELLVFKGNRIRVNNLPESIQAYALPILDKIERQPPTN
jgi:hypothetical protein